MPTAASQRPPAPTCEDYCDDDPQDSLADARASANSAVKRTKSNDFDAKSVADKKSQDGSDSGYSSKAGTAENISTTSGKKGVDLKIKTDPIELERERQPYTFAPSPPEGNRSPTKSKAVKADKKASPAPRFRHDKGTCWVCDDYGFHFDINKDNIRSSTTTPGHTQKVPKSPAPKARSKEDSDSRPTASRRTSSMKRDARPVSMYAAPGVFALSPQPVDYSHPAMVAHNWQPAAQPILPYPYYQHPVAPPTPLSATYGHPGFFDVVTQLPHADAAYIDQSFNVYREPPKHANPPTYDADSQRSIPRDTRPRSATQKSRKATDVEKYSIDRASADRISMPPPPRPEAARPMMPKSTTDYPHVPLRQRSVFDSDDEDRLDQPGIVPRERNSSHSRPPSSYKAPVTSDDHSRPRPRKSSSYSTSSGTVYVASSSQREMPRRRTDPMDQKVSEAERYVASTNKQKELDMDAHVARMKKQRDAEAEQYYSQRPANPAAHPSSLTAETLRKFEQKHGTPFSDTASVQSKHSSSRGSANGRLRAATTLTNIGGATNITMENGFSVSIPAGCSDVPLDIMVGNLRLSNIDTLNEDGQYLREQRRIERAPSEASHTSRRSLNSSGGISLSKAKEDFSTTTRSKQSANSSKRSSRAGSTNRTDKDIRSIDYSVLDESYYLEY